VDAVEVCLGAVIAIAAILMVMAGSQQFFCSPSPAKLNRYIVMDNYGVSRLCIESWQK
jgi:hypothetical protein